MLLKPWVRMPSKWILDGRMAKEFTWSSSGSVNQATAIAALQLWISLITQSEEEQEDSGDAVVCFSEATYSGLMERANLSRKLVASGLAALQALNLLEVEKIGRHNRYRFVEYNHERDWCKLPAQALYQGRSGSKPIPAFRHFQKRVILELDALKMYLYFAAVRPRNLPYTQASYPTIYSKLGVIEARINRTNSFLLQTGLLADVRRLPADEGKMNRPNGYYLSGHRQFFKGWKAINPQSSSPSQP